MALHAIFFEPWRARAALKVPRLTLRLPYSRAAIGRLAISRLKAGDLFWVQEAWRTTVLYNDETEAVLSAMRQESTEGGIPPIFYEADGDIPPPDSSDRRARDRGGPGEVPGRLRSAETMPRYFSRITLRLTSIVAEAFDTISDDNALPEGFDRLSLDLPDKAPGCETPGDEAIVYYGLPGPDGKPVEGQDSENGWPLLAWDRSPRMALRFLLVTTYPNEPIDWLTRLDFEVHPLNIHTYLAGLRTVGRAV